MRSLICRPRGLLNHGAMLLVAAAAGLLWGVPARAETHRVAVVVGNNAGSGENPPLRYAETDAGKMARMLVEVGEVRAADLFLVQGGSVAALEGAFRRARERVADAQTSPSVRTMLIFYFSGHGEGDALELGRERLTFAGLRELLGKSRADLKLAVIDACQSGRAIARKGGKPAPAFTIGLMDQLTVTGEVIITSTAESESALESAELQGSFFTSHFVSGLRGAADVSGDRRVTLAEAYRYAYDRTVIGTSATRIGAQHPMYDFRVAGQGELVLAALDRASARLSLPAGPERILVTDVTRDQVLAELAPGSEREIAVVPGEYGVRLTLDGRTVGGRVVAAAGSTTTVRREQLTALDVTGVAAKGLEPGPAAHGRPVNLCVLRFKNLTGDSALEPLAEGLAEAVATDFGRQPGVRLVERAQLDLGLKELEFSATKYVDAQTRAEIGRIQGAEVVVFGGFQRAQGALRVNARLVHVESGEILHAFRVERPAARLLDAQDEIARQLREAMPRVVERLRPGR